MAHNNPIRVRQYISTKRKTKQSGGKPTNFRLGDLPAVAGALGIQIPEVIETAKRVEERQNEA